MWCEPWRRPSSLWTWPSPVKSPPRTQDPDGGCGDRLPWRCPRRSLPGKSPRLLTCHLHLRALSDPLRSCSRGPASGAGLRARWPGRPGDEEPVLGNPEAAVTSIWGGRPTLAAGGPGEHRTGGKASGRLLRASGTAGGKGGAGDRWAGVSRGLAAPGALAGCSPGERAGWRAGLAQAWRLRGWYARWASGRRSWSPRWPSAKLRGHRPRQLRSQSFQAGSEPG